MIGREVLRIFLEFGGQQTPRSNRTGSRTDYHWGPLLMGGDYLLLVAAVTVLMLRTKYTRYKQAMNDIKQCRSLNIAEFV